VFAFDHRFALSHPALASAPSTKIALQRQLSDLGVQRLYIDRWRGRCPASGPKISEALASSCDFHVVIWLG
jgi:hypothetical protein